MRVKTFVVPLQLLVANPLDLRLLLLCQPLPHAVVHLDDAEGFGMPHHLHVLKALEGIGQYIPLDLLIGHVLAAIEAVGLFDDQAAAAAIGVVITEEPDAARSAVTISNPLNPR